MSSILKPGGLLFRHSRRIRGGGLSYAEEVLADSPLGYWRLDGDNLDSSGNGYDGDPSTQYDPWEIGGNSEALAPINTEICEVPSFPCPDTEVCIELWVNWQGASSMGNDRRAIKVQPSGFLCALTFIKSTEVMRLKFEWAGNGNTLDQTNPGAGIHHYVMQCDGSLVKFYHNGSEIYSNAADPVPSTSPSTIVIGATAASSSEWDKDDAGNLVAHAAIYDHALSPERILAHYDAGVA